MAVLRSHIECFSVSCDAFNAASLNSDLFTVGLLSTSRHALVGETTQDKPGRLEVPFFNPALMFSTSSAGTQNVSLATNEKIVLLVAFQTRPKVAVSRQF